MKTMKIIHVLVVVVVAVGTLISTRRTSITAEIGALMLGKISRG
jgi:hypothetical protein